MEVPVMKNKMIPVLALLFALLIIPATFAQDDNVTADDEQDLKLFDVPIGAQYRFLQLQLAITRNALIGTEVLDVVQTNHPDGNFSELNIILDDMESLLDEVKAYNFFGKELNTIAEDFVTFKKEATNLTKEFRNASSQYLTSDDRKEIASRTHDIWSPLSGLMEMINSTRREMNAYRMDWFFGHMGMDKHEFTQRIRDGNATFSDVLSHLNDTFRSMNRTCRIDAIRNLTSAAVRRESGWMSMTRNVSNNLPGKMLERKQSMMQERENKRNAFQHFENRTERVENVLNDSGRAWAGRLQSGGEWRARGRQE
jgi:hypothetical protein